MTFVYGYVGDELFVASVQIHADDIVSATFDGVTQRTLAPTAA